jgi:hypothetical protein
MPDGEGYDFWEDLTDDPEQVRRVYAMIREDPNLSIEASDEEWVRAYLEGKVWVTEGGPMKIPQARGPAFRGTIPSAPPSKPYEPPPQRTYLDRRREMPALVRALTDHGAWVFGSKASLDEPGDDWDIVVPIELWASAAPMLGEFMRRAKPTSHAGFRVQVEGVQVDFWPAPVGQLLQMPWVRHAWHPKSGRVISAQAEVTVRGSS